MGTKPQIIGYRKPDPRFFRHALAQLSLAPEEVLFIGDSLKLDIEPALDLGIRAVLIDRDGLYPYYKGEKIGSIGELVKDWG